LIAAICAGPIALSTHLYDADDTLKNKFKSIKLYVSVVDSEVNNRHLITIQGRATAIAFGLKILSCLTDDEIRKKVLA
jgi:putative intracellular protease/amidase